MKKDFIKLTKGEKAVLLLKSGEELSNRSENGFDIHLFHLDDFFAELSYQEHSKKIIEVGLIEKESILTHYPNLIDLRSISRLPIED